MSKKIDESPKAPLSERVRGFMWKGMEADSAPVPSTPSLIAPASVAVAEPARPVLDSTMQSHIQQMADYAGGIQHAAARDGLRTRGAALESASRVISHVERLELELVKVQSEYNAVIEHLRAELADARSELAAESAAAQAALETESSPPAALPSPSNGSNGHGAVAHA